MGKKLFLITQSVLCILLVILLSAMAIGIYRDGVERRVENPLEWIYTQERVAEGLSRIAPLFWLCVGLTVAGLFLGVRDDGADKMARDIRISRALKSSRSLQQKTKGGKGEDDQLTRTLRLVILGAAVVLIFLGALNGGARDMLYKAAKICTECVGLG